MLNRFYTIIKIEGSNFTYLYFKSQGVIKLNINPYQDHSANIPRVINKHRINNISPSTIRSEW